MSSTISKEVSKGTNISAVAATNADDKSAWQASKPLIQLAVFTGCGVACGFAFEKARGSLLMLNATEPAVDSYMIIKIASCRCIFIMLIYFSG